MLSGVEFSPEEVIVHGWQTIVYRRKGIPFVVKTPQEGHNFGLVKGIYELSAQRMGDTAAEFSLADVELKGARPYSGEAFVQVQGEDIGELIEEQGREEELFTAVTGVPVMEHLAMARGNFLYANFFKNNIFHDGKVQVADLGHTSVDLDSDLPHMYDPFYWPGTPLNRKSVMNKRGFVIYERANALRSLGREDLREAYFEAMGLDYDDNVLIGVTDVDVKESISLIYSFILHHYSRHEYKEHMEYYGPGDYFKDPASHVTAIMALVNGIPGRFEGIPRLTNDLINLVTRNKYDDEFQRISQQEYDMFFGKEKPVAMTPFLR